MGEDIKNLLGWIALFGGPTLFAIIAWCISIAQKINILMRAQKAQMRSQLLDQFHKYEAVGFIREEDLADWENQYQAYHKLVGPNGVLDARRDVLLKMPTSPQQPKKSN